MFVWHKSLSKLISSRAIGLMLLLLPVSFPVSVNSCATFALGTAFGVGSALGIVPLACQKASAAEEEFDADHVLVVFVFDKSCRISCDAVRPIFKQLKTEYADKVKFVELDVSKDVIGESQKTAKSLKVDRFLDDTEDWYPAVGVFTGTRKKVKEILGAKPKEQYVDAIEKALIAQQKEGTTSKGKKVSK